ncbi:MAG: hypothetical protein MJ061_04385, partial [Mailhella sp.]|nr:hypothetical protein [Mailhella sp.]
RVTIPDAELPAAEWPKHTPESYAELMRSLLVWMDDPNHEAIPLVYGTPGTHSIIVRPGKQALVIFDNSGVLAADMSVPAIVQFFEELVRRKIGEGQSGNAEKERLRRRIADTISRLRRIQD